MILTLVLCLFFCGSVAFSTELRLAEDVINEERTLGIRPVRYVTNAPGTNYIAGREVEWFHHSADPSWGQDAARERDFAVIHPKSGDALGAPLILELHSHGYHAVELVHSLAVSGDHDIWKAPDEFYQLVPDCSPRPPQDSPDFWWCGANHFHMPTPADMAKTGMTGLSSCEKRVLDTLEWTIREYGIDRNRVYVCGNSMGGQGALGIGLNHGDIFAAVKANVPAGVWFPCARLGMVDASGADLPFCEIPFKALPDPPICIEYSAPNDHWSQNHEVFLRNMARCRYPLISYWGSYGHANADQIVLGKNDIVNSFDWLSIKRDEAYPVFTKASCDDESPWGRCPGAGQNSFPADFPPGQINAFFRWALVADTEDFLELELWVISPTELGSQMFSPPEKAIVDVSLRRLKRLCHTPGMMFKWHFGEMFGSIVADENGLVTIPSLHLSRERCRLTVVAEHTSMQEKERMSGNRSVPDGGRSAGDDALGGGLVGGGMGTRNDVSMPAFDDWHR